MHGRDNVSTGQWSSYRPSGGQFARRQVQRIASAIILSFAFLAAQFATISLHTAGATPFCFQGIGDLPGGAFISQAWGISADGSTVVGTSSSTSGEEAFRWTDSTGMVGLGDLPGHHTSSHGWAVSADGAVVVGDGISTSGLEATRWTSATGMVGIGDLPGANVFAEAFGVSADGSVIVGRGTPNAGTEAFRWTASGGMVGLGDFPGGDPHSEALSVSGDGSVVVGFGTSSIGREAFRWTAAEGMVRLGILPDGKYFVSAAAVSYDGSAIVGHISGDSSAFRWTSDSNTIILNGINAALALSGDGSVVVGHTSSQEAVIWTAGEGTRDLRDLLIERGVTGLTDWQLWTASGVSADGQTITGWGVNPQGQGESWIATIPEPSSFLLLFGGMLGLIGVQWHRRRHCRRV